MRKLFLTIGLLCLSWPVWACTNQSTTVTVPYPTGTADVVVYDQVCAVIAGTDLGVHTSATNGPLLNGTSIPAASYDASGFHLTANGAARGASFPIFVVHIPSGKSMTMTLTVGTPVSSISAGTTSP